MNDNNLNNGVNQFYDNGPETVIPAPKGKKSNALIVILLVIILLLVCGYGVYSYTDVLKPKDKAKEGLTTTTSVETTTKSKLGNLTQVATTNIEKSLNITFSDTDIVAGKDYIQDYDFRFAFLVYLYSYESENLENGENGTTGLFTMNLDSFKGFYLKAFGEDFDISKLNSNSTFYKGVKYPTISDNKIHSSFYTGPDPLNYKYEYESMCEENGLYKLTYLYGYMKESGNDLAIQPYGSSYLTLNVDPKGIITYKSFVSTK